MLGYNETPEAKSENRIEIAIEIHFYAKRWGIVEKVHLRNGDGNFKGECSAQKVFLPKAKSAKPRI